MSTSILSATPQELFYVGSAIVVGVSFLHIFLLWVRKVMAIKFKKTQPPHFLQLDGFSSPVTCPHAGLDEKVARQDNLPAKMQASARGLIASLPPRKEQSTLKLESSWQQEEVVEAVHGAIIHSHDENRRTTYLGAATFENGKRFAHIFGWHRSEHQATLHLGEIARFEANEQSTSLRVELHPEDARMVFVSGWGKLVTPNILGRVVSRMKDDRGVEVSLMTPRSQSELEQVTKVVLNASVWWMAGLDEEEDV